MNPADFEPGKMAMIPLTINRDDPADQAKLAKARHRSFEFVRSAGTDEAPWTIKTDGGIAAPMDPRRISAAPQLANGPTPAGFSGEGTLEIWSILGNGGWSHPVHVHFEEGSILQRGGKAPPDGKNGPARMSIGSAPRLTAPTVSRWPSVSANLQGPTWSIATTPSTRTTPCFCAGTSSVRARSS
jgi:hypothetical protein